MSVVSLRPGYLPTTREVNPQVVEELEKLLEMAKAGEVVGFAVCTLHPGDLTAWQRAGAQTRALIGAAEMMKFAMCREDFE